MFVSGALYSLPNAGRAGTAAPTPAETRPGVRIWLCGELRVEVSDRRVDSRLTRRKSRELLALLAINAAGMGRERLIELLWPDEAPDRRDCALRQLLCELRQCLGADVVEGRALVRLVLPARAFVDVLAAERAVGDCWGEITAQNWGRARELARTAAQLACS